MLEFLVEIGLFSAKAVIIVIAVAVVIGVVAGARSSRKSRSGAIIMTNISEKLDAQYNDLMAGLLDKKSFKSWKKAQKGNEKKRQKRQQRAAKVKNAKKIKVTVQPDTDKPRVFVLDFVGDIKASQAQKLSREITAIIQVAKSRDEVVLRLESAGGMVHGYGLASSQLYRLREHRIRLTVCVDKVAASGGYMMASTASKIVAAPFAIVGSIGVIAQIPNFNKLLKNWQIDFEQHTSGKYKRTLTMLGENTTEGREKFREDLDNTHKLFKGMIRANRPKISINRIATGETWYGQEAVSLKLVDRISTSDEYLYRLSRNRTVYHMEYKEKKSIADRLGQVTGSVIENLLLRWMDRDQEQSIGR